MVSNQWGIEAISFCEAVGSRVTCSPIPNGSDEDWLCYTENMKLFVDQAIAVGFKIDG
jgi:hypothetical protein